MTEPTAADRGPSRLLRAGLILLPAAAFLLALPLALDTGAGPPRPEEDLSIPVGDFSLTERGGATVTDEDLKGEVWIASFVFTRCTGPCPQVTGTVARLQEELKDLEGLRLVTFTVDPGHDDPAELGRYADSYRADPGRWLFLTGGEEEIHRLVERQFRLAAARTGKSDPGELFEHSTKLAVVDRDGNIRGYYDGIRDPNFPDEFEAGLARLEKRVRELVRTAG